MNDDVSDEQGCSSNQLSKKQSHLVIRYMPLARAIARRASNGSLSYDELEAEAYAALVEAAVRYDPHIGVDFSVFARPRIQGAIWDYRRFVLYIRRQKNSRTVKQLDDADLLDRTYDSTPDYCVEMSDFIAYVFKFLTKSQIEAFRLIYFEGKSIAEAATILGISSRGQLWRKHQAVLAKLQKLLGPTYGDCEEGSVPCSQ